MDRISNGATVAVAREGGELMGLALLTPLDWESVFFGVPMAELQIVVGRTDRQYVTQALFDAISCELGAFEHITLRVDAADSDLRFVAQGRGYRLMDTLCSYEYDPRGTPVIGPSIRRYEIRPFESRDTDAVIRTATKCFASYENRFRLDPKFGPAQGRRFYETWARNCCDGSMADNLLVAEYRGEIVGFLGWRMDRGLLRYANVKLRGGGLGGCVPTRYNAYKELLWHAINTEADVAACFDTHVTNLSTINVYQELGLRYARVRHTFHYTR